MKNSKKVTKGSISIAVLILLAFILIGAFALGITLMVMSHGEDKNTVGKEVKSGIIQLVQEKKAEEEKAKTKIQQAELEKGTDWFITYAMPSCYKPLNDESSTEMGKIRIHWMRVTPEQVLGTQLASDTDIIFTGTMDGRHLELTDKGFYKGDTVEPFQIYGDFSEFMSSFQGIYMAKIKYKDQPIPGCPADGNISGGVSANPI